MVPPCVMSELDWIRGPLNVQNETVFSSPEPKHAQRAGLDDVSVDEARGAEQALAGEPDRNFAGVRLAFVILLVAAIALPLVYVSISAVADLNQRKREAADATSRVARIAEEHAIKVFDINQALDERVIELLGTLSDDEIRQNQRRIHDRLKQIGGGYPQVASVTVFGRDGQLLVDSRVYPSPNANFNARSDIAAVRDGKQIDISPLTAGTVLEKPVFNTSIARKDANGNFNGVVSVALRPGYFYDFYQELAGTEKSLTIGLAREDGALLVHYPPDQSEERSVSSGDSLPFHAVSELLDRLVGSSKDGSGRTTLNANGDENIIAYRRAGGYPVYVFASYPSSAVIDGWLARLALLAAGVFIPCLALWLMIWLSLRRLSAEERAWSSWRKEAATRRSVEAAFRQARRMQALGNLVGSVAHDFNNLLMTMSANAQVVRRRGAENAENEIAAIERAILNGQRLTRQLLGVARKQPQSTETITLQQWLPRVAAPIEAAVGARVELTLKVAADTWPIQADTAEFELALMNLAVNARDAMPVGGMLTIEVENIHLSNSEAFAHAGDFVRVSVTDTGAGMPQAVLARAFEPLFTTKPQGMGTGLGLPQVSGFCEQAGGTVTIESKEGEGTTVRCYLPKAGDPDALSGSVQEAATGAADPASSSSIDATEPAPMSILLVEDNPEVAAGTEALLSVMGHRTRWIDNADTAYLLLSDPNSAVDAAATDSEPTCFDLVLSDIHMPGKMNGIDLALQLRQTHPRLPIVLVTGYASEIERAKLARIPVLAKPFDVEVLESLIARAAAERESGRPVSARR